jgi:hypothetical protein
VIDTAACKSSTNYVYDFGGKNLKHASKDWPITQRWAVVGVRHALQVDAADRVALRRYAKRHGDCLAEGHQGRGGIRTQFHHAIDIVATILELTGIRLPKWSMALLKNRSGQPERIARALLGRGGQVSGAAAGQLGGGAARCSPAPTHSERCVSPLAGKIKPPSS